MRRPRSCAWVGSCPAAPQTSGFELCRRQISHEQQRYREGYGPITAQLTEYDYASIMLMKAVACGASGDLPRKWVEEIVDGRDSRRPGERV